MFTNTRSSRSLIYLCSILLFAFIGFSSCNDLNLDNTEGVGKVNLHLSNVSELSKDPGNGKGGPPDKTIENLEEVNIDVQVVEVLHIPSLIDTVAADSITVEPGSENDAEWVTLDEIEPQVINLLNLTDSEMLLGSEELEEGFYAEIRLILGSNNNVVVDGETHSLKVPSGQQSGYKIKLGEPLHSGEVLDLTIEFDAEKSVKVTGNGQYMLQPVLKAFAGSPEEGS